MTESEIQSGICGHKTLVRVEDQKKYRATCVIESSCPNFKKVAGILDAKTLDMMQELFKKGESQVLCACQGIVPHVSCPVPAAVLKTLDVGRLTFDSTYSKPVRLHLLQECGIQNVSCRVPDQAVDAAFGAVRRLPHTLFVLVRPLYDLRFGEHFAAVETAHGIAFHNFVTMIARVFVSLSYFVGKARNALYLFCQSPHASLHLHIRKPDAATQHS